MIVQEKKIYEIKSSKQEENLEEVLEEIMSEIDFGDGEKNTS